MGPTASRARRSSRAAVNARTRSARSGGLAGLAVGLRDPAITGWTRGRWSGTSAMRVRCAAASSPARWTRPGAGADLGEPPMDGRDLAGRSRRARRRASSRPAARRRSAHRRHATPGQGVHRRHTCAAVARRWSCTVHHRGDELSRGSPTPTSSRTGRATPAALDYGRRERARAGRQRPVFGILPRSPAPVSRRGPGHLQLPFGIAAPPPGQGLTTARSRSPAQNHGFAVLGPGGAARSDRDEPVRWNTELRRPPSSHPTSNLYDRPQSRASR